MHPAIWLAIFLPLGLIVFFVVLSMVLHRTGGYAPGWRVRCTHCGHTRDAGEVGVVRIKAAGRSFFFTRCGGCRGWHWIAIERVASSGTQQSGGE